MAFINKSKTYEKFTTLPNSIFDNKNLSLKATGLLAYALSKPPGWRIKTKDVIGHFKDGRDAVYSGIKELIEEGYMLKVQGQKNKGGFTEVIYFVYDTPLTEKQRRITLTEITETGALTENPPLSNTNIDIYTNTSNTNTHVAKPSASASGSDKKQFSYKDFIELFNEEVGSAHRGDTKSKGSFKARKKEGYIREDFKKAIKSATGNKHLMGENDSGRRYLTPEYITRSDKLDFWLSQSVMKKKGGFNVLNKLNSKDNESK